MKNLWSAVSKCKGPVNVSVCAYPVQFCTYVNSTSMSYTNTTIIMECSWTWLSTQAMGTMVYQECEYYSTQKRSLPSSGLTPRDTFGCIHLVSSHSFVSVLVCIVILLSTLSVSSGFANSKLAWNVQKCTNVYKTSLKCPFASAVTSVTYKYNMCIQLACLIDVSELSNGIKHQYISL